MARRRSDEQTLRLPRTRGADMNRCIYLPIRWLGYRGLATPWLIIIDPKHKDDDGLHKHERIHLKQMKQVGFWRYMWRYFVLHWLGDSSFRAEAEHAAFKWGSGYTEDEIVDVLVQHYGVDAEQAIEAVH